MAVVEEFRNMPRDWLMNSDASARATEDNQWPLKEALDAFIESRDNLSEKGGLRVKRIAKAEESDGTQKRRR